MKMATKQVKATRRAAKVDKESRLKQNKEEKGEGK